jgi:hypothetical protein
MQAHAPNQLDVRLQVGGDHLLLVNAISGKSGGTV